MDKSMQFPCQNFQRRFVIAFFLRQKKKKWLTQSHSLYSMSKAARKNSPFPGFKFSAVKLDCNCWAFLLKTNKQWEHGMRTISSNMWLVCPLCDSRTTPYRTSSLQGQWRGILQITITGWPEGSLHWSNRNVESSFEDVFNVRVGKHVW